MLQQTIQLGEIAMRLDTDNTTRFFSVVGVPYIAERHFDNCNDDAEALYRPTHIPALPQPCVTGSWLQNER